MFSRWFLRRLTSVALLIGIVPSTHVFGWFDDFNDGNVKDNNPVTWLEDLGGSTFFPGLYDASSGDYVLDPAEDSPTGQMSALVPAFSFTDTYMRTQGKVLPDPNDPTMDDGNLVLTARIDPNSLTGYLVYFDVGGTLQLQILEPGPSGITTRDIGTMDFVAPFNASSEVVLELDVVGDQLSAYAWLADDPNGKPATPQVTATDTTYTTGIAGLGYDDDGDNTSAVHRYATAQSTPFVDTLPGDFNVDGKVDAADYVQWRDGPAEPAGYDQWRANFGAGVGGSALSAGGNVAAAVPEPAGLVLSLLATVGLVRIAGRRRTGCHPAC
jgi:hypothetical protein